MPPKRKAAAVAAGNKSDSTKPAKKTKTAAKGKSSPKETEDSSGSFKYCNADTLTPKPKTVNLQWPNIADFIDDDDQDMPKEGEIIPDDFLARVSDLGMPVTEEGSTYSQKLSEEAQKRDQDLAEMHIYSDWTGYGVHELLQNVMLDFNKDLFKKTVSPYKKWVYIEALMVFAMMDDHYIGYFTRIDDGEGVARTIDMIGLMALTTFDMLKEHGLLKEDSAIENIPIICLLLLQFIEEWKEDPDTHWGCEVVRCCDEAGIDLTKHVRKQVNVSKEKIQEYRKEYKEKKKATVLDDDDGAANGNGYEAYARKKDWTPKDDLGDNEGGCSTERKWFRWDWKKEFTAYQKSHMVKTRNHYDLTRMTKAQKKKYDLNEPMTDEDMNNPEWWLKDDHVIPELPSGRIA